MRRAGRKNEWSVTLFCASVLILLPPILSIFDKPYFVMGFPLSFIVLYGVWALIIFAVALGSRRRPDPGETPPAGVTSKTDPETP